MRIVNLFDLLTLGLSHMDSTDVLFTTKTVRHIDSGFKYEKSPAYCREDRTINTEHPFKIEISQVITVEANETIDISLDLCEYLLGQIKMTIYNKDV